MGRGERGDRCPLSVLSRLYRLSCKDGWYVCVPCPPARVSRQRRSIKFGGTPPPSSHQDRAGRGHMSLNPISSQSLTVLFVYYLFSSHRAPRHRPPAPHRNPTATTRYPPYPRHRTLTNRIAASSSLQRVFRQSETQISVTRHSSSPPPPLACNPIRTRARGVLWGARVSTIKLKSAPDCTGDLVAALPHSATNPHKCPHRSARTHIHTQLTQTPIGFCRSLCKQTRSRSRMKNVRASAPPA